MTAGGKVGMRALLLASSWRPLVTRRSQTHPEEIHQLSDRVIADLGALGEAFPFQAGVLHGPQIHERDAEASYKPGCLCD